MRYCKARVSRGIQSKSVIQKPFLKKTTAKQRCQETAIHRRVSESTYTCDGADSGFINSSLTIAKTSREVDFCGKLPPSRSLSTASWTSSSVTDTVSQMLR